MTKWRHVEHVDGGRVSADVRREGDSVLVRFEVDGGFTSSAARTRIVHLVFQLPEVRYGGRLRASMPLGESQLVLELSRRCATSQSRAAGSTCLLDGDLLGPRQVARGVPRLDQIGCVEREHGR